MRRETWDDKIIDTINNVFKNEGQDNILSGTIVKAQSLKSQVLSLLTKNPIKEKLVKQ